MNKIISFDLDGTLVNARYGDIVWNYGIPLEYSKKYRISFEEAKALVREQYESVGDHNVLWYEIDYWLEKLELPVSSEGLLKRYESYIEPVPYAGEVLTILGRRHTLAVASNAARIFVDQELDHTGFRRHFTHIISATTDYKMVKKEKAFYTMLCEHLQVSPSQLVHVGDHPVFDYDTPVSLGIESYYLMDSQTVDTGDGVYLNGRKSIRNLRGLLELENV